MLRVHPYFPAFGVGVAGGLLLLLLCPPAHKRRDVVGSICRSVTFLLSNPLLGGGGVRLGPGLLKNKRFIFLNNSFHNSFLFCEKIFTLFSVSRVHPEILGWLVGGFLGWAAGGPLLLLCLPPRHSEVGPLTASWPFLSL